VQPKPLAVAALALLSRGGGLARVATAGGGTPTDGAHARLTPGRLPRPGPTATEPGDPAAGDPAFGDPAAGDHTFVVPTRVATPTATAATTHAAAPITLPVAGPPARADDARTDLPRRIARLDPQQTDADATPRFSDLDATIAEDDPKDRTHQRSVLRSYGFDGQVEAAWHISDGSGGEVYVSVQRLGDAGTALDALANVVAGAPTPMDGELQPTRTDIPDSLVFTGTADLGRPERLAMQVHGRYFVTVDAEQSRYGTTDLAGVVHQIQVAEVTLTG